MAAIGAVMLSLLRAGDHVVASQFLFGNTVSLLNTLMLHGIDVTFVDATDAARRCRRALTPATRMVFVETIANPRTQVADLARIGALCAERGIVYVVDNTMTSPCAVSAEDRSARASSSMRSPSTSAATATRSPAPSPTPDSSTGRAFPTSPTRTRSQPPAMWGIAQIRKKGLRDWGGTLAAEQAHHIAVGAETLALRMERVCANAQALAERLAAHPKVRAVYYPGLATPSAARARARRLFRGFGGLLAFELADGIDCFDFLNRLSVVIVVVESRRQPDARDPGRAHDLLGDGRRASRGDGHRRFADPRVGRHRGSPTT